jgi:hypothetical protein
LFLRLNSALEAPPCISRLLFKEGGIETNNSTIPESSSP